VIVGSKLGLSMDLFNKLLARVLLDMMIELCDKLVLVSNVDSSMFMVFELVI
jgi:hypothetical protein